MQELERKGKSKRQLAEVPSGIEEVTKMIKEKDVEKNDLFKKNVELTTELVELKAVV
jgi:hypothetical protein